MIIHKAILHIFDFNTNMCILSQKELDFGSDIVYEYVDKRIMRILNDPGQKTGVFYATSSFQSLVQQLAGKAMEFGEFAATAGKELYQILAQCDVSESIDFLAVDFQNDNDAHCIGLLLLDNKTAYTHQILDDGGMVCNQLIKHQAILPGVSQKAEAYAIINLQDFSIHFVDTKRQLNGEPVYVLPDRLLQCTSVISGREAVKIVSTIAAKVAQEHGASPVEALSKTKNYLTENAETADTFSPQHLGADVFAHSSVMQQEFEAQVQEAQLPAAIAVQKNFVQKAGRSHKIKTDTGIEIIFPSEYVENTDYIQFINNPDGTISIELKNIGKIVNK